MTSEGFKSSAMTLARSSVRLSAVLAGALLLWRAGLIIAQIFGENDNGALLNLLIACVPGFPGLALVLFAVFWKGSSQSG